MHYCSLIAQDPVLFIYIDNEHLFFMSTNNPNNQVLYVTKFINTITLGPILGLALPSKSKFTRDLRSSHLQDIRLHHIDASSKQVDLVYNNLQTILLAKDCPMLGQACNHSTKNFGKIIKKSLTYQNDVKTAPFLKMM